MQQVDSERYNLNMVRRAERSAERQTRREMRRRAARRQTIANWLASLFTAVGAVAATFVGFVLGWYNTATWIGPGFDLGRDWPACLVVGIVVAIALNAVLIYTIIKDEPEDSSH